MIKVKVLKLSRESLPFLLNKKVYTFKCSRCRATLQYTQSSEDSGDGKFRCPCCQESYDVKEVAILAGDSVKVFYREPGTDSYKTEEELLKQSLLE